jgi:hypothetical protein
MQREKQVGQAGAERATGRRYLLSQLLQLFQLATIRNGKRESPEGLAAQ